MKYKVGIVSIVGFPNAGKSTLINHLVGQKLVAVSDKAQTTRKSNRVYYAKDNTQIIFVDVPGFTDENTLLNQSINLEIKETFEKVDVNLFLLSTQTQKKYDLHKLYELTSNRKQPTIVCLNKIDLKPNQYVTEFLNNLPEGQIILRISAEKNQSHEICNSVVDVLNPFLRDADVEIFNNEFVTNMPVKDICSEFIREKCFDLLNQELPYNLHVNMRKFEEGKVTKMYADIVVSKDGQKKIIIGTKGEMIKQIGVLSRKEIEKFLQKKVYLELHVKVDKNWSDDKGLLKKYGYKVNGK